MNRLLAALAPMALVLTLAGCSREAETPAPAATGAQPAPAAQTSYPGDQAVTLVVPFSAGGPTDRVARDLAEALRQPLGGATVVVENWAG